MNPMTTIHSNIKNIQPMILIIFLFALLIPTHMTFGVDNPPTNPTRKEIPKTPANTQTTPVTVKIKQPINGWSSDRILVAEAEISDPSISFAYLIENGNERMVRVKDRKVSEQLVLSPGTNQIIIWVIKDGIVYSDQAVLYSNVPKKDIKIILSWDTDQTDIDLHVINPQKNDCYYGNRETKEGGVLDVDITDGYGPEVFTQANATTGEYTVRVHYFNSNEQPQSLAKVQVILFEGTDYEKKYHFEKMLTLTGDTYDVGTFNIKNLGKEK